MARKCFIGNRIAKKLSFDANALRTGCISFMQSGYDNNEENKVYGVHDHCTVPRHVFIPLLHNLANEFCSYISIF